MAEKVCLGVDKARWQTSPLPGHIVLVSTVNHGKVPNVAPKSWVSTRNILATKEFVINVPSEDLAETVWKTGDSEHEGLSRLRKLGFTLFPSVTVAPPSVKECKAHLECVYDSDKRYGDEIWIFGEIVFACIDEKALQGSQIDRYKYLNPIFYLEEETYGTLGDMHIIKTRKVSPK